MFIVGLDSHTMERKNLGGRPRDRRWLMTSCTTNGRRAWRRSPDATVIFHAPSDVRPSVVITALSDHTRRRRAEPDRQNGFVAVFAVLYSSSADCVLRFLVEVDGKARLMANGCRWRGPAPARGAREVTSKIVQSDSLWVSADMLLLFWWYCRQICTRTLPRANSGAPSTGETIRTIPVAPVESAPLVTLHTAAENSARH